MATSTSTIVNEMDALPSSQDRPIPLQSPIRGSSEPFEAVTGHVVEIKESWKSPRINTYRLAAIFYAFIIFGMNDGSYGALVPYVGNQISSESNIGC